MDFLMIVRTFIEGIFVVLIIPGVPFSLFLLSMRLALWSTELDKERARKIWAWYLGIAVFFLVVVLSLFTDAFAPRDSLRVSDALWMHLAIGFFAGFVLLALVEELRKSSLIAILITVLSGGSLTALYFYVFFEKLQEPIRIYAPTMLVGALAYIVFVASGRGGLLGGNPE